MSENYENSKSVDNLSAGESVSVTVKLISDETAGTIENEENTNSDTTDNNSTQAETGDESNAVLWTILIGVSSIGLIILIVRKKKYEKQILSILICGMLGFGIFNSRLIPVEAENKSFISISETINIDGKDLTLEGSVKYKNISNESGEIIGLPRPDNPTEIETYYWNNSTVIDIINASESEETLSEKEAKQLMEERGFTDYDIIYDHQINGEYMENTVVNKDSDTKHPIYTTYYLNKSEELWTINIINGSIYAYPVSYVMDTRTTNETIISETKEITSYDDISNTYYVIVLNDSSGKTVTVDNINSDMLDKLTIEEMNKL